MPAEIITTFVCTNSECSENDVPKAAASRPAEGVTATCGTCGNELTEDASRIDEWQASATNRMP
jgi:hypothetical protein